MSVLIDTCRNYEHLLESEERSGEVDEEANKIFMENVYYYSMSIYMVYFAITGSMSRTYREVIGEG